MLSRSPAWTTGSSPVVTKGSLIAKRETPDKVLSILDPGGVFAWHDYTVFWPAVYGYLGELSHTLNLARIARTHLVVTGP